MEKIYKMVYRQRVYKNSKFSHQRIQHFGEGPVKLEWPDGTTPDDSQIEEDVWVEVERTVTPFVKE